MAGRRQGRRLQTPAKTGGPRRGPGAARAIAAASLGPSKSKARKPIRGKKKKMSSRRVPNMSALSRELIPTLSESGEAFPTWARSYHDLNLTTTTTTMLFFTNCGQNSVYGSYVTFNAAGGVTVPTNLGTFAPSTLIEGDDGGGASAGRAMKLTYGITNTTQRLNQGGRVSLVNVTNRLSLPAAPALLTDSQWLAVSNGLRSQVNMEPPYDGADFSHPKTRSCVVVDRVNYENFGEWQGSEGNTAGAASAASAPNAFDAFWATVGHWPGRSHLPRGMSTQVIILSQTPVAQSYSVDVRAAWYTRWPTLNILSNHLVPIPSVTGEVLGATPDKMDRGGINR